MSTRLLQLSTSCSILVDDLGQAVRIQLVDDIKPKNIDPENTEPENPQPENIDPENTEPKNINPENTFQTCYKM
jgi:hypothetical protein